MGLVDEEVSVGVVKVDHLDGKSEGGEEEEWRRREGCRKWEGKWGREGMREGK